MLKISVKREFSIILYNYVSRCILKIIILGEHLMSSGRVFHSVAAAVSINRLPSFTVLPLFGL